MIRTTIVFWIALFISSAYAQGSLKKTEFSSDFFLADVQANGAKLFPVKYQGACIVYNKKTKEFLLYGDANGTDVILIEKIKNTPLRFYPEHFISCTYKDGKVYLSSQINGKATVVTGVFIWKDESMIWEKEETFDLSEQQVLRAKNLVKDKKIPEALATYDSVQYAETYYDIQTVGIELLLASNTTLTDFATRRKFKESADLQEKILNFKGMQWFPVIKNETDLKTTLGKGLHGLTYAALQDYMALYVGNLLEAKQYDKTIEKGNAYWKYFTGSADLYLKIADAWYAKKDKKKASEFYVKYTAQMKVLKKEKDIPYYVPQRIIEP